MQFEFLMQTREEQIKEIYKLVNDIGHRYEWLNISNPDHYQFKSDVLEFASIMVTIGKRLYEVAKDYEEYKEENGAN